MKLYRVALGPSDHSCYALADSFDGAAQAAEADLKGSYIRHIEDLGVPVQWQPTPEEAPEPEPLQPAVSIKKSVTPDFLICLEDGLKFKSLRRHLTTLGLTPAQYRAKWSLPDNYPMVAANYSAKRAELARSNGLGRK